MIAVSTAVYHQTQAQQQRLAKKDSAEEISVPVPTFHQGGRESSV